MMEFPTQALAGHASRTRIATTDLRTSFFFPATRIETNDATFLPLSFPRKAPFGRGKGLELS